ncbi:MAG: hypothetical protein V1754_04240, partial [Pseudomonadota bacterium]
MSLSERFLVAVLLGMTVVLTSCGSDITATSLRVTVTFDETLAIDQLRVSAKLADLTETPEKHLVPETPTALTSGLRLVILVPDTWDAQDVKVEIEGLASGVAVGRGSGVQVVLKNKVR